MVHEYVVYTQHGRPVYGARARRKRPTRTLMCTGRGQRARRGAGLARSDDIDAVWRVRVRPNPIFKGITVNCDTSTIVSDEEGVYARCRCSRGFDNAGGRSAVPAI